MSPTTKAFAPSRSASSCTFPSASGAPGVSPMRLMPTHIAACDITFTTRDCCSSTRTASVTVAAKVESVVRFWNSDTSTRSFAASTSLPISVPARPSSLNHARPATANATTMTPAPIIIVVRFRDDGVAKDALGLAPRPPDDNIAADPDVMTVSSATSKSLALCQRSAGFFSRQRMITASSAGDTLSRYTDNGSAVRARCAAMICCALAPANGVRPASISYAITPTA